MKDFFFKREKENLIFIWAKVCVSGFSSERLHRR